MDTYEILHSPFDIETHKENFVNYLEVVILKDGTIEYAVPSHQKKLESLVDPDKYDGNGLDYLDWLMDETEAVCVWSNGFMGIPNFTQRQVMLNLTKEGLMEYKRMGW